MNLVFNIMAPPGEIAGYASILEHTPNIQSVP